MCCHTVSLSQERLKALSAPRQTMRKVLDNIGVITEWYRSGNGVVTGKTAEKQDKCTQRLSREHIPAFTPYTLHFAPYSMGRLAERIDRSPDSRCSWQHCWKRSTHTTRRPGSS